MILNKHPESVFYHFQTFAFQETCLKCVNFYLWGGGVGRVEFFKSFQYICLWQLHISDVVNARLAVKNEK